MTITAEWTYPMAARPGGCAVPFAQHVARRRVARKEVTLYSQASLYGPRSKGKNPSSEALRAYPVCRSGGMLDLFHPLAEKSSVFNHAEVLRRSTSVHTSLARMPGVSTVKLVAVPAGVA